MSGLLRATTTRPVSRSAAVRELDRRLIQDVGVPGAVLMEHAGHLVADAILARHPRPGKVAILCGPGNNGGDGYVVARHLAVRGIAVRCVPVTPPKTDDARTHAQVAERLGLVGPWDGADLVVDAIFGTGQRAPLVLPPLPSFDGLPLVALDVPTGIDADTGARLGDFPSPDFVVTIGRLKPFLFADPRPYTLVDIGLELRGTSPEAILVDHVALAPFSAVDTKWSRGHVGVYAGSEELAGAGVLACRGALRAGAGLVTLLTPRAAWGRLGALPAEVMVRERVDLDRYDALVVGPGLGRSADEEVRRLWATHPKPCVFDADALTALDGTPSAHPRLLTPHAGEAARLLGRPWRALESDRLATAHALRVIAPTIYKGACPVVTGSPIRILWGANPALATGGSGDVLAGVCGALLARHAPDEDIEDIALAAAWLHQRAGALAGGVGVTASEIADRLGAARLA